jgi:hypothetical protein
MENKAPHKCYCAQLYFTYQGSEGRCGDIEVVICDGKRPSSDGTEADTREDVPVSNKFNFTVRNKDESNMCIVVNSQ